MQREKSTAQHHVPVSFDENHHVEIDFQKHAEHLARLGLKNEQITEVLEALFYVAVAFVEFGYGVHPAQRGCGKTTLNKSLEPSSSQNALHSELSQHISGRFSHASVKETPVSESEDA